MLFRSKIELAQKKSIRNITNNSRFEHTEAIFKSLGIMPFRTLLSYSQSLLTHSIYHKYSPRSLHNIWTVNRIRLDNQDVLLRNAEDLYVPFARTDQCKLLPFFSFPKFWNNLHIQKFTPNPITFKIAIKEFYLN